MKQKRAEEIAQYGLIVAQCLFIIFILVGLALENETLMMIALLMLLYYPALVSAVVFWVIRDSFREWRKRRKRTKRLDKSLELKCPSCNKIFNRNELDVNPTATPICPKCEERLLPLDYSSK